MKFSPFFIGVMPFPGSDEGSSHYDDALVAWHEELKSVEARLSEHRIYTERIVGNSYRWMPLPADGEVAPPKRRSQSSPPWQEILVGLSSPALAVAFYKILKAWIAARAGRKIKLKFGEWEADFRGLTQRQVVKLFRVLKEVAATSEKPLRRPEYLKRESKSISTVLKEQGIPAVKLKVARASRQRVQYENTVLGKDAAKAKRSGKKGKKSRSRKSKRG